MSEVTLEVDRDVAEVISSGRWFHVWGPETKRSSGTVRRLVTVERKARRPGRSATRTNGPRYQIPFICEIRLH